VLVLDNLHEIVSAEVHSGILQLTSQASRKLRIIAVTRHDPPWPLHTMRLDGRVRELRAADLAFHRDEAAALFAQMDVEVTGDQLGELVLRTEGWAAGLRLAVLGLRGAADREEFVERFSGDEHSVAEYLMREVFEQQSADWQDFLLRIAVVEEVCPDLADALTGQRDGGQRLALLAEANLFLHELGGSGHWYRMHHLLVDFLNARLTDPRLRRDLNRRAAEWYRTRHMPIPALRFALAGRQWGLAADVVATHVVDLITHRPPAELEAMLAPLSIEVLLAHPGLAISLAAARAMRGDLTDLDLLTGSVRAQLGSLSDERRRRFEVVLDGLDIARLRVDGDIAGMLDACRRIPIDPHVLSALGLESWDAIRVVALGNMGGSELWLGELDEAREHLRLATAAAGVTLLPRLNARAHQALLDWHTGHLADAAQTAEETVGEFSRIGMPLVSQCLCAYLALTGIALDRDELDVVDRWLDLATDTAIEPHALLAVSMFRARREAASGRLDQALAAIQAGRQKTLDAPVPAAVVDRAVLLEADLCHRAGNRAQAHRLAAGIGDPARHAWPAVRHRARTSLDEGNLASEHPAVWPAPTNLREAIETHLLGAQWASAAGDDERAMGLLEKALAAAAPHTIRRVFLDESPMIAPLLSKRLELGTRIPEFAVDLLDRMSGAPPNGTSAGRTAIVMPLTAREGLMLRYLASTLSNVDISRELYISVNTVKTHQRMIYRKLAVNDRRDAVARGRQLGLL
jgi:LuxR family maltose regulon positive regulatory protein